jgi:phosphoribosylformylglycinamidine cyclo-ligase
LEEDGSRDSKYKEAGVDIDRATEALDGIRKMVQSTHLPNVLHGIGSFGALLHIGRDRYVDPVLVMSVDGVGTKLKVAFSTGKHDTVGQDLVNHCVDDILVQGAKPIAFMDYFATGKLEQGVISDVMSGLVKACLENECSLIGGETAEMPDFYREGEYDLAGCILGITERNNLIDGMSISSGDVIIGLPSTGLHTNGYSLARKIIFETKNLAVGDTFPGTNLTVGDVLLEVHRSYFRYVHELVEGKAIKGMVHITGGGFYDNVPRVLPEGITAVIDANSWSPLEVFEFLEREGEISKEEMYRVFNMGIGFLLIISKSDKESVLKHLGDSGIEGRPVGRIESGGSGVELILPRT